MTDDKLRQSVKMYVHSVLSEIQAAPAAKIDFDCLCQRVYDNMKFLIPERARMSYPLGKEPWSCLDDHLPYPLA